MQPAEVLVKATGLSLGYAQRTVLHDLNLEVRSGEFWFALVSMALAKPRCCGLSWESIVLRRASCGCTRISQGGNGWVSSHNSVR